MNYKYAYFGNDETKMLAFVDQHWDRVLNFGYSSEMEGEKFEVPGYYVRYAKASVPAMTQRKTAATSK